ncbi:hypothetical protein ES703_51962 [subsurface metagenome]
MGLERVISSVSIVQQLLFLPDGYVAIKIWPCSMGIKYDGWLLLINLLLDVRLPKKRHDKESCFFLGEGGCLLKARHVICVNYLCKKITDQIDPHKLNALREKEGVELDILFLLNERLKIVL